MKNALLKAFFNYNEKEFAIDFEQFLMVARPTYRGIELSPQGIAKLEYHINELQKRISEFEQAAKEVVDNSEGDAGTELEG